MKKLLKVTALFLVAAAMLAGCKNNSDDDSNSGELFSKDDVSIEISYNDIVFSDGDWVAVYNYVSSTEGELTSIIQRAEFTISNDGADVQFTRSVSTQRMEGTIPEGATEEAKKLAQAMGYKISGNTYYTERSEEADATELSSMTLQEIIYMFYKSTSILTNDDKSKYYTESTSTYTEYGENYTKKETEYIMKK